MISKQRQRQLDLQAQGLCITCGQEADDNLFCAKHRRLHRENSKRIYHESDKVGGIKKKVLDGEVEGLTKRQISRAKSWLRLKGYLES
jgi:hypothetical protein